MSILNLDDMKELCLKLNEIRNHILEFSIEYNSITIVRGEFPPEYELHNLLDIKFYGHFNSKIINYLKLIKWDENMYDHYLHFLYICFLLNIDIKNYVSFIQK